MLTSGGRYVTYELPPSSCRATSEPTLTRWRQLHQRDRDKGAILPVQPDAGSRYDVGLREARSEFNCLLSDAVRDHLAERERLQSTLGYAGSLQNEDDFCRRLVNEILRTFAVEQMRLLAVWITESGKNSPGARTHLRDECIVAIEDIRVLYWVPTKETLGWIRGNDPDRCENPDILLVKRGVQPQDGPFRRSSAVWIATAIQHLEEVRELRRRKPKTPVNRTVNGTSLKALRIEAGLKLDSFEEVGGDYVSHDTISRGEKGKNWRASIFESVAKQLSNALGRCIDPTELKTTQ